MLITILAITVALVAWSLHLMQEAMDRREFSLMLAGTLVAFSAAALVAVYFLMGNYIGYMAQMAHRANQTEESVQIWISQLEPLDGEEISSSAVRSDVFFPQDVGQWVMSIDE
ncbi:hypothetical protein ACN4EK_12455 [Pantanalinema rosaneae CENA516]|uniref:hypothetical protein n=1 Tax=Pantanalinema rosaneae TaxID=1620701 RepID=UPI003D6E4237